MLLLSEACIVIHNMIATLGNLEHREDDRDEYIASDPCEAYLRVLSVGECNDSGDCISALQYRGMNIAT